WAQMGRGEISETAHVMASPIAPKGHAPPLGVYRLVVPGGGPLDLTAGAPAGVTVVELAGPTGLRLRESPTSVVTATTLGGRHLLGRVPVEEPGPAETGRGRFRIGAPLQPADVSALVAVREQADEGPEEATARSDVFARESIEEGPGTAPTRSVS